MKKIYSLCFLFAVILIDEISCQTPVQAYFYPEGKLFFNNQFYYPAPYQQPNLISNRPYASQWSYRGYQPNAVQYQPYYPSSRPGCQCFGDVCNNCNVG